MGFWNGLGIFLWTLYVGGTLFLFLAGNLFLHLLRAVGVPEGPISWLFPLLSGAAIGCGAMAAGLVAPRFAAGKTLKVVHWTGAACTAIVSLLLWTGGGSLFRGWFSTPIVREGERFQFGPYPEPADLARLKREGTTSIVTLLSPVLPFEGKLLREERIAVQEAGLRLVEIPLVPWILDEKGAAQIRALTHGSIERYYLHCYLGRHRTDMALALIHDLLVGGEGKIGSLQLGFVDFPASLERGEVFHLPGKVLVGPLPTPDEWNRYVRPVRFQRVISMLDPDDAEDLPWIEAERTLAGQMGVPLTVLPVRNPEEVREVLVAAIRETPGPVYVHGFKNEPRLEWVRAGWALETAGRR